MGTLPLVVDILGVSVHVCVCVCGLNKLGKRWAKSFAFFPPYFILLNTHTTLVTLIQMLSFIKYREVE